MVDWTSAEELELDASAFSKLLHALLGLYLWEWFISLDFDVLYLFRLRRFQWPLIFYFLGRYSMLIALIGVVVSLNVTAEIDCQALFTVSQLFGNIAILCSATNLSLRTMAVWGRSPYIVVPLAVALIAYAGILLRGVIGVIDVWVPEEGCTIVNSQITILRTIYIYGMSLDFIVLSLTVFKLAFNGPAKTPLVNLLLGDGLLYFAISFTANTLAVIFMMLNLNAVMGVVADVPAVVICTVAACRVVRRLTNHSYTDKRERFIPTAGSIRLATRPFTSAGTNTSTYGISKTQEVHVQMDNYGNKSDKTGNTAVNLSGGSYDVDSSSPDLVLSKSESVETGRPVVYDASGRIVRNDMMDPDTIDPVAQAISAEFNSSRKDYV